MRMHVVAFQITNISPTAWTALEVVDDSVFAKASDTQLFVPAGMQLLAAFASAPPYTDWDVPQFRIKAASLLRVNYPEITPVNPATLTNDPNIQVIIDRPIQFPRDEPLGVDVKALAATTPGTASVVLLFADGTEDVPAGEAFWIASTSDTPSAQGRWTALTSEWPTLPEGEYLIVGMAHVCPSGVAARLRLFSGQTFRPGTIATSATTDRTSALFIDGRLGVMGRFTSYAPPVVEVMTLDDAVDVHRTFLRVIRVA